jgi:serine/threonine protein kinase
VESGERPPGDDPPEDGEQPPAPDSPGVPDSPADPGAPPSSPDDPAYVSPTSPPPNDNTRPGETPPLRQWKQFTLLQEVGRGGFGVVYRAWDPGLSCERALKIIDMRRLPERGLDDWLREGRMLAQLRHPNVVSVHGVEVLGDEIGLCMEFVHGRTLADLVVGWGVFKPKAAVTTAIEVCDALTAVHGAGLVHRDLKASNVMREKRGRTVLMDFGAGRERITEPDGKSRLIGTPACMAPEVLRGQPATPASDIYSLGVLLFYLVTGKYPVPGDEFVDLCLAHDRSERRHLADYRQDLPPAFVTVVESALDPRPAFRPDSAAEFRQELLKARATHPVPVPPDPVPVRLDPIPPPPPPPPPPPSNLLRRAAVTIAAIAMTLGVCAAVGFVTTLEFNNVLGRSGEFARESPLVVLKSGVQSLVGPAIWVSLLLLLFNAAVFGAKLADRFFPRLDALLVRARGAAAAWVERRKLSDPDLLMRGLAALSLLFLAATLWACLPLLKALASPVSTGAPEILGRLNTDESLMPFLYRRAIELDLVLLAMGTLAIRRFRAPRNTGISTSAWSSVFVAAALALLFLAGPWRIIFASKFTEAQLGAEQCFVIGESAADVLLHCPGRKPPRNAVASKRDPDLKLSGGTVDELFASYPAGRFPSQ